MNSATSSPVPTAPTATADAWPRSAQLVMAFLLGVLTCLLLVYSLSASRMTTRPALVEGTLGPAYRVDLNHAGRGELLQIPGVGEKMAQRIEAYRQEHGPFHQVGDLTHVGHVGQATLQRLGPWIAIGNGEVSGASVMTAPPTIRHTTAHRTRASKKAAKLKKPVDINRAGAGELQCLPGVGATIARRIMEERERRPFHSVEELRRVSGIGPIKLERMRPYVTVGGETMQAALSGPAN